MSATSPATMTNKSLDAEGTGNSVTNLKDSNIKSGAAISRAKLASGTANHVLINDPTTGAMSSEALLDRTRGGTGVSSSATFPTSGTVAVLTDITASNLTGILASTKGGTGVNNAGTLTYGANNITLSTSGVTSLTLPATGTLATLSGAEALLNKTISSTALATGALSLPSGTQAQRPGTPVNGMVRYNSDSGSFEGYANSIWSGIGGGGTTDLITQATHGFVVGDVLYLNGSTYTKAIATNAAAAEVVGMVSRVIGTNQFELTLSGEVSGLTGLTAGEVYFLSAATAGAVTITEPSVAGQVSVPVGVASSTTTFYVAPKRGVVVGGVNARAEVSLTSGATTNVQDLSAYDAGELTGWVFLSTATAARFFVSVKFAKSGPGGDYNMSYQTTGDNPPAGFSLQISTTGMLSATLPAASGTTSVINYALNAPAIGASFPLSVDASTVQSGTLAAARLPGPTSYSDADATRMGLKSYTVGVPYNGGNVPDITTNTSSFTVKSGQFIPYQMQDGSWRLKFNLSLVTAASVTQAAVWKFSTNIISAQTNGASTAPYWGLGSLANSSGAAVAIALYANTNELFFLGTFGTTNFAFSGDFPLLAKPNWAY